MTKISYIYDPHNSKTPYPGRAIKSEVVRENFQVLANASSLWAYDSVSVVAKDTITGDNLMTRSGAVVTVTTETPHELETGDLIIITGAEQTDYNGIQTVTAIPSAYQFVYGIITTPDSPATGDIKVYLANSVGVTAGSYQIGGLSNLTCSGGLLRSPLLDLGVVSGTVPDAATTPGVTGDQMIAVLSINSSGNFTWTKGLWAASPVAPIAPTYVVGEIPICEVLINFDSVIFNAPNQLAITAFTSISLSGIDGESLVTVSLEKHGILAGDIVRISNLTFVSGDATTTYEEGWHEVVSNDTNTFTYSISGTFTQDSEATAYMNSCLFDVRPLLCLGGVQVGAIYNVSIGGGASTTLEILP